MMRRSPFPIRKLLSLWLAASLVCLLAGQVAAGPVPMAHWPLDGNANDTIGGYNGVLSATGAVFVPGGVAGSAVSLDESQGGLVNMGPVIDLAGISYTISLWIKTTTKAPDTCVLSRHRATLVAGYLFGINANGPYGAADKAWFYNQYPPSSPKSVLTVNDGVWRHLAGVREFGGNVSLYVDGQFQAAHPDKGQGAAPPGTPLLFGGHLASDGVTLVPTYTGLLDDVQIYRGSLTAQQVQFLYQHPGQVLPVPGATVPATSFLLLD